MKTTSVAIFALVSVSALAQPIVVLKGMKPLDTRDLAPSGITDLEARKIHINWKKVGNFFKGAAKIGASILFRRNEDGDVFLVARDLIDDSGDLLARDFDDEYLEARDLDDYLEARGFDDDYLEARDFDDEYLEIRDFDDYLEARDFDDDYLEARDLEERSLLGGAFRIGEDIFRGAHKAHQVAGYIPQRHNNNNNQPRDLEERSLLGGAFRIGEDIFRGAHKAHHVASYIPQRHNNNNNQPRDLEGGLYDLD